MKSRAMLLMAGALLGFDDEKAKVFDIAIQTGAILAVIIVYWQKIRDTLVALPNQREAQRFRCRTSATRVFQSTRTLGWFSTRLAIALEARKLSRRWMMSTSLANLVR